MNKRHRTIIAVLLLSGAFTAGVFANDIIQRVDAYLRPDYSFVLNGEPLALESPALIYNDRTYLPLKELGNLLGANVLWRGDTKTIFINKLINVEQEQVLHQDNELIEMKNPSFVKVSYLGGEYPLLTIYNNAAVTQKYYRLTDVRRMGIDTDGLKKAKDKLTGFLFVSEAELKTRWAAPPKQVYTTSRYFIGGETHAGKLESLTKYIDGMLTYKIDHLHFTVRPLMMDKIAENEYEFLYTERVYSQNMSLNIPEKYYMAKLIIRQGEKEGLFAIQMDSRKDLLNEWEKSTNQKK